MVDSEISDPFVQWMKERTQKRGGAFCLKEDKENDTLAKTLKNIPPSSSIATKLSPIKKSILSELESDSPSPKTTSSSGSYYEPISELSSTSSTLSDSPTKRFRLLASRSKQMQEWDDDYSYHFLSKNSTKEDIKKPSYELHDKVPLREVTPLACNECTNNSHSPNKPVYKNSEESVSKSHSSNMETFLKPLPTANLHNSTNSKTCLKPPLSYTAPASVMNPSPVLPRCSPSKRESYNSSPCHSPTRTLKWDKSLLNSLEAQGFTPSDSRSRLFYDFENDDPKHIETPKASTKSAYKIKDKSRTTNDTFSCQPKEAELNYNKIENSNDNEFEQTPSKVGNLRNRWEEHIRQASPERPHARSPSPVKRQPKSTSALQSNTKSPSTKFHFGSATAIGTMNLTPCNSEMKKPTSSHKKKISSTKIIKGEIPMPDVTPVIETSSGTSVRERAAAFAAAIGNQAEPRVDPSEMTVRDRRSLFEKKNAPALIPKAPFGQNVPISSKSPTKSSSTTLFGSSQKLQAKSFQSFSQKDLGVSKSPIRGLAMSEKLSDSEYPESDASSDNDTISEAPPKPPRAFFEHSFEAPAEPPIFPCGSLNVSPLSAKHFSPGDKFNSTEIDDQVGIPSKKPYVPKYKPGCMFPSLSDIESHSEAIDSQSDDDLKDSSFMESILACSSFESLGKHIQKVAQSSDQSNLTTIEEKNSQDSQDNSPGNDTMDVLGALDEAIDGVEEEVTPTATKRTRPRDEDIHYAPVQKIIRYPDIRDQMNETPVSPSVTIAAKIRKLEEEETRQLNFISQASAAISVVDSRPDDNGSPQHIEAEKLLLFSMQKHLAIKDEIKRLKMDGSRVLASSYDEDLDSCRGTVNISKITLNLKKEFINDCMKGEILHHLFVLVKHRDQVIASEVSTTPKCVANGSVIFPNKMSLHNLKSDFSIALEVYCLSLDAPHAHSTKKKHSKISITTPLKRLQREARISSPSVHSPGGPTSVRASSFRLIGFTYLNINSLTSNSWILEKVPYRSPLNEQISMRLNCSMEGGVTVKSFLTMFEDVGGLGCWNRRWCVLRGPFLRYWKYPDDEQREKAEECLGYIDLRCCTNRSVELTSRDLCARQHTFQLFLVRPAMPGDSSNLVQEVNKNAVVSRIQLSADSKEERFLWCKKLTKALANIRAWDPDARRPQDFVV